MPFGQASGPSATHKQLQYLEALVRQAGHDGFRDARGPLGLSQRQAAGKFTRDEASALIDMLVQGDAEAPAVAAATRPSPAPDVTPATPLDEVPTDALTAELERRGWTMHPPSP